MTTILKKIIRRILEILYLVCPKQYRLSLLHKIYFFSKNKEIELFNIEKLISKKGSALDIGCNKGLYSFALAKQKKISNVFAFEPNTEITSDIKNFKNKKIKLFNYALSNKNIKQKLIIPIINNTQLNGWGTLEKKKISYFKKCRVINVKTMQLDKLNLKNISFVKIDVEGHERQLLKGSKKFFKYNRPNVLIEVKKDNLNLIKKFFKELNTGYKLVNKKKFNFKFSKENYFFSTDLKYL